jgi:hypothetical protein
MDLQSFDSHHYTRHCIDCPVPIYSFNKDSSNCIDFQAAQAVIQAEVKSRLDSQISMSNEDLKIAAIWGCLHIQDTLNILGSDAVIYRRMFNVLITQSRRERIDKCIAIINIYDSTFDPYELRNEINDYIFFGKPFQWPNSLTPIALQRANSIMNFGC